MTQRIVITANMNKPLTRGSGVTYQWHWRRIFAATSLLLLTVAVITYSFLGSVNAEQSEPEQAMIGTELVAEIESPAADDAMEQLPESLLIESAQHGDEDGVTTDSATTPQNIDIAIVEQSTDSDMQAQEHDAEFSTDVTVTDDEMPDDEQNFAESAHVANVAMGAQIDIEKVSRAVLTTQVLEREPVDVLKTDIYRNDFDENLSFFSEIKGMQGQIVRHIWYFEGEVLAEIELAISAPRYRTYSTKNIMPNQLGQWRVEVVTTANELLAHKDFRILAER